jgi:dienelactone hydrolase
MKYYAIATVFALLLINAAGAAILEKEIEYKFDGALHQGYVFFDDSKTELRPGILIVHEWKGISENVMQSGHELAKLGYVAFAVDIYGKDVRPKNNQEAAKVSGSYKKNRQLLRSKVLAGMQQLKKQPYVDSSKIGAIGYCFGGTTVLEMARSGYDLAGVVSFHGGLDSHNPEEAKKIKCKVLVLHGADDPHVSEKERLDFIAEMRATNVDWQLFQYGNAVHSFTNKSAGTDNSLGAAYNEKAATRSWQAMKAFFKEIFF